MSEFIDVMRQARRMCKAQEDCESCPLWNTENFFCKLDTTCYSDDSAIENIIMQWAAKHPETAYPTLERMAGQNSTFQDTDRDVRPCEFGSQDRFYCTGKTCAECMWQNLFPPTMTRNWGIKSKEAK